MINTCNNFRTYVIIIKYITTYSAVIIGCNVWLGVFTYFSETPSPFYLLTLRKTPPPPLPGTERGSSPHSLSGKGRGLGEFMRIGIFP